MAEKNQTIKINCKLSNDVVYRESFLDEEIWNAAPKIDENLQFLMKKELKICEKIEFYFLNASKTYLSINNQYSKGFMNPKLIPLNASAKAFSEKEESYLLLLNSEEQMSTNTSGKKPWVVATTLTHPQKEITSAAIGLIKQDLLKAWEQCKPEDFLFVWESDSFLELLIFCKTSFCLQIIPVLQDSTGNYFKIEPTKGTLKSLDLNIGLNVDFSFYKWASYEKSHCGLFSFLTIAKIFIHETWPISDSPCPSMLIYSALLQILKNKSNDFWNTSSITILLKELFAFIYLLLKDRKPIIDNVSETDCFSRMEKKNDERISNYLLDQVIDNSTIKENLAKSPRKYV